MKLIFSNSFLSVLLNLFGGIKANTDDEKARYLIIHFFRCQVLHINLDA